MTDRQYRSEYLGAPTFEEYLASARRNAELWRGLHQRAHVPDALASAVASLGGEWRLLALSEDWCGDAVNTLPYVARLAESAPNLALRVLARDENDAIMQAHLSPTGARAIPVVIILDSEYCERAWWGSRPKPLQDWVMSIGRSLPPEERYREVRKWYARDRGTTALGEITALLARAAGAASGVAAGTGTGGARLGGGEGGGRRRG